MIESRKERTPMSYFRLRRREVFEMHGVMLGDYAEAAIIAGAPQRSHDRRGDADEQRNE
jgi:hypothetical protein